MTDGLTDEDEEVYRPNEDLNRVLSVLRDFERTDDDPARPLAIVTVEKFLLGAKEQSALNYGTIRNAFEETDGELCIRYEDEYGHGYFGLLRGELRRFMQMSSSDEYSGPYGTTVDLLDRMLDDGSIQLCLREQTPFGEISDPATSSDQEGDPELRADGGETIDRFHELPTPDRFFMQIEPAEIEMQPMAHDDVEFKMQFIPGGKFGVELSAHYSYAGRDCIQNLSLDREGAEALHEALGKALESRRR